jgi:hypothetical protein
MALISVSSKCFPDFYFYQILTALNELKLMIAFCNVIITKCFYKPSQCFPMSSIRLYCWNVIESSYSVVWFQIPTNHNKTFIDVYICRIIPATHAYEVNISQLIRYPRACGSYQNFCDRGLLLTRKLLSQWFLLVYLKSSLWKSYGRFMTWFWLLLLPNIDRLKRVEVNDCFL